MHGGSIERTTELRMKFQCVYTLITQGSQDSNLLNWTITQFLITILIGRYTYCIYGFAQRSTKVVVGAKMRIVTVKTVHVCP
jgi:hypothetical protein